MKRFVVDFAIIQSQDQLINYLENELDLNKFIEGGWGRNLDAFWDVYGYRDDEHLFELRNYKLIKDEKFKDYVDSFIKILKNLKMYDDNGKKMTPNPNFDFKIFN